MFHRATFRKQLIYNVQKRYFIQVAKKFTFAYLASEILIKQILKTRNDLVNPFMF